MVDSETPRRIREDGSKHDRHLQRVVDEERARGQLPSYNDDAESEITANTKGFHFKSSMPRMGRLALSFGIAFLLVCAGVVMLMKAWPR